MRLNFMGSPMFDSFLGLLDIKLETFWLPIAQLTFYLGAEIVLLFGLINKVAGVYGLITIFVGGSFSQLSYYAYSVATLFAFLWALRIVKSESALSTQTIAHLFVLDHLIQSFFHFIFYQHYWYVIPHDGRRILNSQAQQDLVDLAVSRGEIPDPASGKDTPGADDVRKALAGEIWSQEKVFAGWTLFFGFLLKAYFIMILYSYAAHLRSSTYHTLPLTARSKVTQTVHPTTSADLRATGERRAAQAQRSGQSEQVDQEVERLRAEEREFTWD